jgi:hypothetical protein
MLVTGPRHTGQRTPSSSIRSASHGWPPCSCSAHTAHMHLPQPTQRGVQSPGSWVGDTARRLSGAWEAHVCRQGSTRMLFARARHTMHIS